MTSSIRSVKSIKTISTFQKVLAVAVTISIFLPYYITCAAIIAAGISVVINYQRRNAALSFPFSKFILCVFSAWFVISWGYRNLYGMGISLLLFAILLTAFYMRSFMTHKLFAQLLDLSCLCSISCTAVAVVQKLFRLSTDIENRPESVCFNANYFGMLMEFIFIISLYRMMANPKFRSFYLLTAGSAFLGMYLCASMSSCIGACVGVLVLMLFRGRYKTLWILGAVVVIGAIAAYFAFPILFPRKDGAVGHALSQRISIWSTAIKGIHDHTLFGQGPMTYELICGRYGGYRTHHAHNLFIDTLLNFGVVGSGCIAFFVLSQLKYVARRIQLHISTSSGTLLLSMLCAVFIHGMTDVTILWMQSGMLFLLIYTSVGIQERVPEANFQTASARSDLFEYGKVKVNASNLYHR